AFCVHDLRTISGLSDGSRREDDPSLRDPSDELRKGSAGAPRGAEIVTDAGLHVERRRRGDESKRVAELRLGAEWVVASVDEERGGVEPREVGDPKVGRSPRRVEWVGEQEERRGHGRILRGEKARLTSAVGVTSESDGVNAGTGERGHGGAESR